MVKVMIVFLCACACAAAVRLQIVPRVAMRLPVVARGHHPRCRQRQQGLVPVRSRSIFAQQSESNLDKENVINELLSAEQLEALPSLISKRLPMFMDEEFIQRIQVRVAERKCSGALPEESARLDQIQEFVIDFLEQLMAKLEELEPDLNVVKAKEEELDAIEKELEAKQKAESVEAAAAPAAAPSFDAVPTEEDIALKRVFVEQLLDAANESQEKLDALLRENRAELDAAFFKYLDSEIEKQRATEKGRMQEMLESVLQRACLEVDIKHYEVRLLNDLLQTRNPMARRDMYEREIRTTARARATVLFDLVKDTQVLLEKRMMQQEDADIELLQLLRVLAMEVAEYVDVDGDS